MLCGSHISHLDRITKLQSCAVQRPPMHPRHADDRVSDVLGMLAGGATRGEILADFPYLEDADITAALEYAARPADSRVVLAAE